MKLRVQVQQAWQKLSRRERKIVRSCAKGSPDAGMRLRCKIVLALVRGNSPTTLIRSRMTSSSHVYEVMHRFLDQGLLGLADRREDNGEAKVTEDYVAELFAVVPGSPRKYGYRRPTWTQELLILVLHKRTAVRISRTTMSRLLKRQSTTTSSNVTGPSNVNTPIRRLREPKPLGITKGHLDKDVRANRPEAYWWIPRGRFANRDAVFVWPGGLAADF